MDLNDLLAELRKERDQLDAAIFELEHTERGFQPGACRPPSLLTRNPTNGLNHGPRTPIRPSDEGSGV